MDTKSALEHAHKHLREHAGTVFDVLTLSKPPTQERAVSLAKIISKLSPMIGNLIELSVVDLLNDDEFSKFGTWVRQDPDFPDALFKGNISPAPGLEIKAWFPLATEITARFKDSQTAFTLDNIDVAMLAWLPEYVVYGRPKLIDVCLVSAKSVAEARDKHYHNPPDYLVLEPEDTSGRTRNLQQSNTNGYKFQDSRQQFFVAERKVREWGSSAETYSPSASYQEKLRDLMGQCKYRLDTNFAKMDRIEHPEIESFKSRVLSTKFAGMTIGAWAAALSSDNDTVIADALRAHLEIT
jgi:hypothetical protein